MFSLCWNPVSLLSPFWGLMNQHSESDSEQELNTSVFYNYVNANFSATYKQWQ